MDRAVKPNHSLDGPDTKILVIKIGKNEQKDKVLAFASALQHSNK
jgi:hypothetical protein